MKEWFKARNIWGAAIEALSDAEAGRLMKALWRYTMSGEQPNLSGAEKGIFALIQLTLSQDEEQANEISRKRAEAGSCGGKQRVANQANALFASANEAKQTFASNKNKNKNKDYYDDDDEEDDDNRAREEERRAAVRSAIEAQYGRPALPAEVTQISLRARLGGFSPEMCAMAIKLAAENGARNLVHYVGQIFSEWKMECVQTPDEAEELRVMFREMNGDGISVLDTHETVTRMAEARELRKAAHGEN